MDWDEVWEEQMWWDTVNGMPEEDTEKEEDW